MTANPSRRTPTEPEEALDRPLLEAVASLAAIALERLHFVEVAQRTQLEIAVGAPAQLAPVGDIARHPHPADRTLRPRGLPCRCGSRAARVRTRNRRGDQGPGDASARHGHQSARHGPVAGRQGAAAPGMAADRGSHRRQYPGLSASPCAANPVRVELAPDLPLVAIDAVLMERVLCNLLENAAKFSPPGAEITIAAAAERRLAGAVGQRSGQRVSTRQPAARVRPVRTGRGGIPGSRGRARPRHQPRNRRSPRRKHRRVEPGRRRRLCPDPAAHRRRTRHRARSRRRPGSRRRHEHRHPHQHPRRRGRAADPALRPPGAGARRTPRVRGRHRGAGADRSGNAQTRPGGARPRAPGRRRCAVRPRAARLVVDSGAGALRPHQRAGQDRRARCRRRRLPDQAVLRRRAPGADPGAAAAPAPGAGPGRARSSASARSRSISRADRSRAPVQPSI